MTIEAKIIEDSISPTNARLTTFQLRYPRFIHAEFMTHRLFSRNASSSRAIPVDKIIQQVIDNPAMPVYWGKNQKGMQAHEELEEYGRDLSQKTWLDARDNAVKQARSLVKLGLHKQIANRILEPWHHISVVVTATEWDNFFTLRCHPDAQPEIKVLAERMRDLYFSHTPTRLGIGQWHLPYILEEERSSPGHLRNRGELKNEGLLIKASVARCARVSYLTHDKQKPDLGVDVALHDRLFASKHMSPFEHIGTPDIHPSAWSGNFKGWIQYRKTIKGESFKNYQP